MTVVDEINTKNALRITNAWLSEVQYEAPYFGCGDMEAIKKALEKQIQKKPILYGDSEDGKLLCPNCNEDLWDIKECGFNGCPYCLQKLDWGRRWNK